MDAEDLFLVCGIRKCWKSVTGLRRTEVALIAPKPLQSHHHRYHAVILRRSINHTVPTEPLSANYAQWMPKIRFWSMAYENAENQWRVLGVQKLLLPHENHCNRTIIVTMQWFCEDQSTIMYQPNHQHLIMPYGCRRSVSGEWHMKMLEISDG